jgi:GTPase SAR1 family protein
MTDIHQERQQVETQFNAGRDVNFYSPNDSLFKKEQERRYRNILLEQVHSHIEELLQTFLRSMLLHLNLELQEQGDLVLNPWQPILQEYQHSHLTSSPQANIYQIYDRTNGSLLILGEPGSGKTTLLLELTRELLTRARQDEDHPVPVVFPLSEWANTQQPLQEWMISILRSKYELSPNQAKFWLNKEQIFPLLDGLDEVVEPYREECAKAINTFRANYELPYMVVSSRESDYLKLSTRLHLRAAVHLMPLTTQQIEGYFTHEGEFLNPLYQTLQENSILQPSVATPLILNILSAIYLENKPETIKSSGTLVPDYKQLFAVYVQRMLDHRGGSPRYSSSQTIHWLVWLAQHLQQQNLTEFYVERLQPTYLESHQIWLYNLVTIRLPGVFIGILASFAMTLIVFAELSPLFVGLILIGGLLGGFLSKGSMLPLTSNHHLSQPFIRLLIKVFFGLCIGFITGFCAGFENKGPQGGTTVGICWGMSSIALALFSYWYQPKRADLSTVPSAKTPDNQISLKHPAVKNGIYTSLLIGLSTGLCLWQTSNNLMIGISIGLRYGLVSGLIAGFLSMLLLEKNSSIQPADRIYWSWKSLKSSLFTKNHMLTVLSISLLVSVIIGLSYGLLPSPKGSPLSVALSSGLGTFLILGLAYWLIIGLHQGVTNETIEDRDRKSPNQGIRRSIYNGLVIGLISTALFGALGILCDVLSIWIYTLLGGSKNSMLLNPWQAGILLGVSTGLIAGIFKGGEIYFRHYCVRFLLYRSKNIPWHYVQFLNDMVQRMLLHQAGGGYFFFHRLLHDYFVHIKSPNHE